MENVPGCFRASENDIGTDLFFKVGLYKFLLLFIQLAFGNQVNLLFFHFAAYTVQMRLNSDCCTSTTCWISSGFREVIVSGCIFLSLLPNSTMRFSVATRTLKNSSILLENIPRNFIAQGHRKGPAASCNTLPLKDNQLISLAIVLRFIFSFVRLCTKGVTGGTNCKLKELLIPWFDKQRCKGSRAQAVK